jgi:hypothetical protein
MVQRLAQVGAAQRRRPQLANAQAQHLVELLQDAARLRRIGFECDARGGEQLRLMNIRAETPIHYCVYPIYMCRMDSAMIQITLDKSLSSGTLISGRVVSLSPLLPVDSVFRKNRELC